MALIKSRGSIVDQDQNYCVLTSLCYRYLYVYKNIIFSFLFIRYLAFYFAVITKTQLFKRAKHCVKWLGFQGCHLASTERGLSQTTRSDVGSVRLTNLHMVPRCWAYWDKADLPSFQTVRCMEGARTDELGNNKEMGCH